MSRPNILLCLDPDRQPSVFDAVVAVDAGVDHLLRHGNVSPDDVRDLVYGAIFTRGPSELRHTAIFIGGSDVAASEALAREARHAFLGPLRVSVMLDPNGSNTTAAAAVLAAARHLDLQHQTVAVLAATGPVGQRVVRLLAGEGAHVRVGSRRLERAAAVCDEIAAAVPDAKLESCACQSADQARKILEGAQVVIAAGAPSVELLPESIRQECSALQVAVDLSAVPPAGIGGIAIHDKATSRDGQVCYGAIGVGGTKMKIHKRAVARLFEQNDLILDADEIYELGKSL